MKNYVCITFGIIMYFVKIFYKINVFSMIKQTKIDQNCLKMHYRSQQEGFFFNF